MVANPHGEAAATAALELLKIERRWLWSRCQSP
jgi:hypothetical protein